MTNHFNELTPGEHERLAVLTEELGEALQAVGKILLHGYENWNPSITASPTNRENLCTELGHVLYAIHTLMATGDVSTPGIEFAERVKGMKVSQWLHHEGEK
jgi:NTP pyrophosphatase (non-canonical NTP hydrolase)